MERDKAIIVGLAIVAAIFVVFSAVSYFEYSITNSNYKELKGEYESLMEEKNSSVSYWQTKYNSLQSQYNSLQNKYNSLNSNYTILQNQYNSLQSEYDSLQSQYDSYKNMVNTRMPSGGEMKGFINPDDGSVKTKAASILGGGFDGNLSTGDIDKINDWVYNHIDYNHDVYVGEKGKIGKECWQYPNETLKLGYGDCEDQALLVASMCLAEEKVEWLYCAEVELTKESEKINHVCIFINAQDDKMAIVDPTLKNDDWLNPGGWISTEARYEPSALDDYRKAIGADSIVVKCVFNQNIYKAFSGNNEFYNWF